METDFAIDATVPFLGHEWQHLLIEMTLKQRVYKMRASCVAIDL